MGRSTWTKKQTRALIKHYATIRDPRDLESIIGKPYSAIRTRSRVLGLKRAFTANTPWDDQRKINKLIKLYPTTRNRDLAKIIGVSESAISAKAYKLGLVKDPQWKYECSKAGMFKPGRVPVNKGKKQTEFMSREAIEKTKATRFKKGNNPPNSQFDGAIGFRWDKTGRPYVYIRLAKSKWVLFHVYVYECTFGPVPKGYRVSFRDGNSMDCTPGNLELVSDKDHMLRNSASLNLSDGYVANCIAWRDKEIAEEIKTHQPHLIKLKRLQLRLKRNIYDKQQKTISRNA